MVISKSKSKLLWLSLDCLIYSKQLYVLSGPGLHTVTTLSLCAPIQASAAVHGCGCACETEPTLPYTPNLQLFLSCLKNCFSVCFHGYIQNANIFFCCLYTGKDLNSPFLSFSNFLWIGLRHMPESLKIKCGRVMGCRLGWNLGLFPLLLDSVFFFSCVHPQWPSWMMLPGAPPDPETLPPWVLCWLLPLPAFAARGQEVARARAGEAEAPARRCPSAWSPLGWAPRPWTFFVLPFSKWLLGEISVKSWKEWGMFEKVGWEI